jgi:hypothetical protein
LCRSLQSARPDVARGLGQEVLQSCDVRLFLGRPADQQHYE